MPQSNVSIYPSLLATPEKTIPHMMKLLDPYCDGYHVDVMDNIFVRNKTWSAEFVNNLDKYSLHPLWVHLMVENPQKWVQQLTLRPQSIVTFHYEAGGINQKLVHYIKEKMWIPSVAINPKTPVEKIFPYLDEIRHVLIMSVEPGFSGQPFIPETARKLEPLNGLRATSTIPLRLAIDEGVNMNNIKMLADKGANDIVIGSALFNEADPVAALKKFKELVG